MTVAAAAIHAATGPHAAAANRLAAVLIGEALVGFIVLIATVLRRR